MKRRTFLRGGAALTGASLIPVKLLAEEEADLPHVDPESAQAQSLGYVENSEKSNQRCANCLHAKGNLETSWFGCQIFPGKAVKSTGWCNVWAARS